MPNVAASADVTSFSALVELATRDSEAYRRELARMQKHDPERHGRFLGWFGAKLAEATSPRKRERLLTRRDERAL